MIKYFIAVAFLVHFDLSLWWWIAFAVVTIIDIIFIIAVDDRFIHMRERQYETHNKIDALRDDVREIKGKVNDISNGVDEIMNDTTSINSRI